MKKRIPKIVAYVCHPYRGKTDEDVKRNIIKVTEYGKSLINDGYVPIIAHFPTIAIWGFDTDIPDLDKLITEYDDALLAISDILVICGTKISKGMAHEMGQARKAGQKIYYKNTPTSSIKTTI